MFRIWPHTAFTVLIDKTDTWDSDTQRIADMRLRDLCGVCTDIMHDCIYSGVTPNNWIAYVGVSPREDLSPVTDSRKFEKSDDGPQHSVCEFCKLHLPYSRDCGLRDAFFLVEKTAFECRIPKIARSVQSPTGTSISPTLERRIDKLLPFELPSTILRRTGDSKTHSGIPQFRHFVWYRQKLRAARSLLTTT